MEKIVAILDGDNAADYAVLAAKTGILQAHAKKALRDQAMVELALEALAAAHDATAQALGSKYANHAAIRAYLAGGIHIAPKEDACLDPDRTSVQGKSAPAAVPSPE